MPEEFDGKFLPRAEECKKDFYSLGSDRPLKDRADKPSPSALAEQESESIPTVAKGFHEEMNNLPTGESLLEDGSFEFQSCAVSGKS
ncbi:hypothetical protein [Halobacillus litoralis]|uniref:hypothetical protein n=1 Tax=Halobacillus litoralis TaxID=45668 RepID=UPI001CD4FF38|nr:hypothetical protein [Halobacillus litoralis]MCA1022856.1 hypothetical protein [Halobacillus litoralis]